MKIRYFLTYTPLGKLFYRKRLEIGGWGVVGWIGHVQGGGGDTSMITFTAEKCPSYPFSASLNDCFLPFWILAYCPLML